MVEGNLGLRRALPPTQCVYLPRVAATVKAVKDLLTDLPPMGMEEVVVLMKRRARYRAEFPIFPKLIFDVLPSCDLRKRKRETPEPSQGPWGLLLMVTVVLNSLPTRAESTSLRCRATSFHSAASSWCSSSGSNASMSSASRIRLRVSSALLRLASKRSHSAISSSWQRCGFARKEVERVSTCSLTLSRLRLPVRSAS
jgi:hypothetical protein